MKVRTYQLGRAAIWLLAAAAGVAVVYYIVSIFSRGELAEKSIWAVVQGVEDEHRDAAPSDTPLLIENAKDSGLSLLGLPAGGASCAPKCPFVWVVLNRDGSDGAAMQMPRDVKGRVSCEYVDELRSRMTIAKSANEWLRSVCTK